MKVLGGVAALGRLDVDPLRAVVDGFSPARWAELEYRQDTYGVHRATQSVPALFARADIHIEDALLLGAIAPQLAAVTLAVRRHRNDAVLGVVQVVFARLPAGAKIAPHHDGGALAVGNRVHVPVVTAPGATLTIAGQSHHLPVGHIYEIDNVAEHSAENLSETDRVHLIVDLSRRRPDELS